MTVKKAIKKLKIIKKKYGNIDIGYIESGLGNYGQSNIKFLVKDCQRYWQDYEEKIVIMEQK